MSACEEDSCHGYAMLCNGSQQHAFMFDNFIWGLPHSEEMLLSHRGLHRNLALPNPEHSTAEIIRQCGWERAHLDANGIHDNDTGRDAEDVEGHAHASNVGGNRCEVVRKHRRVYSNTRTPASQLPIIVRNSEN